MPNDNSPLLHHTSDSHLDYKDSKVLEDPVRRLTEIANMPLPEKHKQVRMLTKIRKELESANQKLEKRVKLIKKEERLVVDKVISGFNLEKKVDAAKKEDEKMRAALQTIKRKEEQQKLLKQKRISEMKLQSEAMKRENSTYMLAAKRENYLYATDVKREAMQTKQFAKMPLVNLYVIQKQPHDKFKCELQNYSRALQEQRINQNLELVAHEEVRRIVTAKELHTDLQKQQFIACTKLMKQREFHKHYFSTIISPKKNASKLN